MAISTRNTDNDAQFKGKLGKVNLACVVHVEYESVEVDLSLGEVDVFLKGFIFDGEVEFPDLGLKKRLNLSDRRYRRAGAIAEFLKLSLGVR